MKRGENKSTTILRKPLQAFPKKVHVLTRIHAFVLNCIVYIVQYLIC